MHIHIYETESVSYSVVSDSLRPHGLYSASLFFPWDYAGKNTGCVAISFSRGLPNPGIEPTSLMSPPLAGRFFTTSATLEADCLLNVYCIPLVV